MTPTVTVKCVACGHQKEVGPGSDTPICDKCMSPMVAVSANA